MFLTIKQKPDFKFLIYFQWVSFVEDAEIFLVSRFLEVPFRDFNVLAAHSAS